MSGVFLESNVILYLLSGDAVKADAAEELLAQQPTISVQVLNEVASVSQRKLKLSWPEILNLLNANCLFTMSTSSRQRLTAVCIP